MPEPAVRFDRITKRFPGVQALRDVSLEVAAGACHALCGENGAGKSTLGKVLAGIYAPDAGRLSVLGREVHFAGPRDALAAGVGMVHQELGARGVTCIYVSHRMPEIFRLCDTASVLRDGEHVATHPVAALTESELVRLM